MGAKYEYTSQEFLDSISEMAGAGMTDVEISLNLGLAAETFCRNKKRYPQLRQALSHARAKVNAAVRQRYLQTGLGGLTVQTITKRTLQGGVEETTISTTELPPDARVLANWLSLHDEDWKQKSIELKRLDLTSNGQTLGVNLIFGSTPLSQKDILEIQSIEQGNPLPIEEKVLSLPE